MIPSELVAAEVVVIFKKGTMFYSDINSNKQ